MRQHTAPIFVNGDQSWAAKHIQFGEKNYSEQWLQNLIHQHPKTLPIREIEPAFSDAIALCKELETRSGYCDNVLVNAKGYLTIVECKLWRNPEARRSVLAQVLDYAKDLAKWDYQEFERAVLKARRSFESSLFEIVQRGEPDADEAEFIDTLSANLRSARMLLLIAGDGIRENAEDLLDFLNTHTRMQFVLAFVEMPVFQLQADEQYIVAPRVIATTRELRRYIDIDTSATISEKPQPVPQAAKSISEEVFYERLGRNVETGVTDQLKAFVSGLRQDYLIRPKLGRGNTLSLNLKSDDDRFNFASILETGQVTHVGIVDKTGAAGDQNIGIDYLKKLTNLVDGEFFDGGASWNWCVRKNGAYPMISDYLAKEQEWKDAIHQVLMQVQRMENDSAT